MRIEVFCENRLGLARELLDLLVSRHIDLRGIEIVRPGRIYLNFAEIDFNEFRLLMGDIRLIPSVKDVKTVPYMPSERGMRALKAVVESIPDPILSVDLKGNIKLANNAAATLLATSSEQILSQTAGSFISGYNFSRDLEQDLLSDNVTNKSKRVTVRNQNYLMDINPILIEDEDHQVPPVGAVIILKSAASWSYQHKNNQSQNENAFDHIIAVSSKMRQVVEQARKWATLDAPLLIMGDTGTGKDVLALACHSHSARRDMPFLALNCAALPDEVVESELFGHAAGAYPNALEGKKGFFELAGGGSVLLDEIGEMSPRMQTKLLRFLNDGTFRRVGEEQEVHIDVRVICATQRNLIDLVNKGLFREDLYYRLNVLTLQIPPLRDRTQDIMPLTELFTTLFADEQGITRPKLSAELSGLLTQYGWPGNVRQLKNTIYRALTQLEGSVLRPQDIALPDLTTDITLNSEAMNGTLDDICKRFERSVLTQLYGNYPSTRKLAKRLGVSHTAIANKLREYGLSAHKED